MLYKLVNVLLVDDITGKPSLIRDLALIKVNANQATRSQVLDIANVFKARVLDLASESITMEMTGGEEKVDRLLEILTPFGLLEVVRTGAVAMRRGAKSKVPAGELPRPAPSGNRPVTTTAASPIPSRVC